MIGYGHAFVIGYCFFLVARLVTYRGGQSSFYPWSLGGPMWGAVFMGLNWVAGL